MSGRVMIQGARKVANALQDHYVVAYSEPRINNVSEAIADWAGPDGEAVLQNVDIRENLMADALKRLDDRSTPGPDGVPAVLSRCSEALLRPLMLLWRTSLETGYFPTPLKKGAITPIFKGGSRRNVKNYRQVVLTSHVSKVFEIVAAQLVDHLLKAKVF